MAPVLAVRHLRDPRDAEPSGAQVRGSMNPLLAVAAIDARYAVPGATVRRSAGGSGRLVGLPGRAPVYCRPCESTTLGLSLRDRRDARPDPAHLPRHPELRRPAVSRPAAVDGAHARARAVPVSY